MSSEIDKRDFRLAEPIGFLTCQPFFEKDVGYEMHK
jgi:hypothetical protein